jgi:SSS family solute:Na+ symporter
VTKGLFYVGMLAAIMSSLNTLTFVSATTLGRDLVLRWRQYRKGLLNGTQGDGNTVTLSFEQIDIGWTRAGLILTGVVSIALSLAIPSVIDLWYAIGTVIIPGLLVPLVTSYFGSLTVSPRWGFLTMVAGWGVSTVWLGAGWMHQFGSTEFYPFGIEPMYPGIAASLVVWGVGMTRRQIKGR